MIQTIYSSVWCRLRKEFVNFFEVAVVKFAEAEIFLILTKYNIYKFGLILSDIGVDCAGGTGDTFHNIDYMFKGYNLLRGFPQASGHDPGFTFSIFAPDYSAVMETSDCRMKIPEGYEISSDVSCITSLDI